MSLFKDFKDDVSQAANELMDELDSKKTTEESENGDIDAELQALFGEEEAQNKKPAEEESVLERDATLEELAGEDAFSEEEAASTEEDKVEDAAEENAEQKVEEEDMKQEEKQEEVMEAADIEADFSDAPADDETATITKGTEISGNIKTSGSLEIVGAIEGDVDCKGKLVVSGTVKGKSEAAEIFTDSANVTGDMVSTGSIKIGVGSVVVGNLKAVSAVIAGAVKGDIDVDGPIIIDSTAVVMGNIKSRSVQINNGAVMEGICSQCYSDIDVNTFFEN